MNPEKLSGIQKEWLLQIFKQYFPHIDRKSYSINIFNGFIWDSTERKLNLPQHLKFPANPEVTPELEFDLPNMLSRAPFLNFIDSNLLSDLIKEVNNKIFNIFAYLAYKNHERLLQPEDSRFSKAFIDEYPSCGEYAENVPILFFIELGSRFTVKYNDIDTSLMKYIEFCNENYTQISMHKPNDIVSAFQFFARKIYNLRAFGIRKKITDKDYYSLNDHLYKYLEEKETFLKTLIQNQRAFSDHRRNWERSFNEELNMKLMIAFAEMVNKELEVKPTEYTPIDPERIIQSINNKSNRMWLLKQYDKEDLPKLTESEANGIQKIWRDLLSCLNNGYLNVKSKSRAKIESVSLSENVWDKIWAMSELLEDPTSQTFLERPDIKQIFTESSRKLLSHCSSPKPESIDSTFDDPEGNGIRLIDTQLTSVSTPNEKTPEDTLIDNEVKKAILACKEPIFACIDAEFSNDIEWKEYFTEFVLSRLSNLTSGAGTRIQANELSQYSLKKYFKVYISMPTSVSAPTIEIFREKMRNILHSYIEIINTQEVFR